MLAQYDTTSTTASINALKEIIQEIILSSLSKTDFFDKAAFYGGTALRIFHNLNRFSEDMVFSLKEVDSNFSMDEYVVFAQQELNSYGFEMDFSTKPKQFVSPIKSGFLKGNTLNHLVKVFSMDNPLVGFQTMLLSQSKLKLTQILQKVLIMNVFIDFYLLTFQHHCLIFPHSLLESFTHYCVEVGKQEKKEEIFMIMFGTYKKV